MVLQTTQGPERPDAARGRQCVFAMANTHELQLGGHMLSQNTWNNKKEKEVAIK